MHLKLEPISKLLPLHSGAKVFLFLFLLLFLVSSCNKSSVVGLDVQPEGDLLNAEFTDTTTLITYVRTEDSVRSDETSINLLGSYNDPVFGKASASIFTQFNTNSVTFGNPSEMQIDSAVLSLVYTGDYYGTTDPQTIKVYPLAQSIFRDSSYYSNRIIPYDGNEIGSLTFVPKPADSVKIGSQTLKPQVRIRLSDAFGQGFLAQGGFTDNTTFLNYFKGLFITTSNTHAPGQGAIFAMSLTDAQSGITLYYRNKFSSKSKQSNFSFTISSSVAARFGHFDHDDALNDVTMQLADSTLGQNLVYVQPMAGVRTKIVFPFLKNMTLPGAVAVSKAELVLQAEPSSTSLYAAPASLALLSIAENGETEELKDQYEGEIYFGGTYNGDKKEYRFNIARHIQGILSGKEENFGLYICSSKKFSEASATSFRRAVLGGGGNPSYRMRLRLTYTKLY